MFNIQLLNPIYLSLILPILVLIFLYYFKFHKNHSAISYSTFNFISHSEKSIIQKTYLMPSILSWLAIIIFILALTRPFDTSKTEMVQTEGIDIAIVLDISGSMLAEDFKPNRLEAAKKITEQFISDRVSDQIGLVVFSRESFTQCPLTIDYTILKNLLKEIRSGMIEDGTAIGNAIANGINRLKDSKAKSKTIILLTDGINNAGEVNPITASEIAKKYEIKIYTIGVGTLGEAPYPFQTPFGIKYQMVPVEIDEQLLKTISKNTDGKYFRATNNKKLEEIYKEIDKLEKTKLELKTYTHKKEYFPILISIGLIMLVMSFLLSKTVYKTLP